MEKIIEGLRAGWRIRKLAFYAKDGDYVVGSGGEPTKIIGGWKAHPYCPLVLIEPDNVYGKPLEDVPIPEGETVIGFRECNPRVNRWIDRSGRAVGPCDFDQVDGDDKRRLILDKKPKKERFVKIETSLPKWFEPLKESKVWIEGLDGGGFYAEVTIEEREVSK